MNGLRPCPSFTFPHSSHELPVHGVIGPAAASLHPYLPPPRPVGPQSESPCSHARSSRGRESPHGRHPDASGICVRSSLPQNTGRPRPATLCSTRPRPSRHYYGKICRQWWWRRRGLRCQGPRRRQWCNDRTTWQGGSWWHGSTQT